MDLAKIRRKRFASEGAAFDTINEMLVAMGGKKLRRGGSYRDYLSLPASRAGTCDSDWHSEEYPCFKNQTGARALPSKNAKSITHITLDRCKKSCWQKAEVICVRTTKAYRVMLDVHLAGECPYCSYRKVESRGEIDYFYY